MNQKAKFCVYCGSVQNLTVDHIPPKLLFPKPRPKNLITVPACEACNKSFSKDDENFRLRLFLSDQMDGHPDAKGQRDASLRSLTRPEAKGLKRSLLSNVRRIQLATPSGIYVGSTLGFDVDLDRIHRVVERIVRGLFFHETNQRLKEGYEVCAYSNDSLRHLNQDDLERLRQTILLPLAQTQPKEIGKDLFSYRFQQVEEDPHFSAWALSFYNRVPFFAMTGPCPPKRQ